MPIPRRSHTIGVTLLRRLLSRGGEGCLSEALEKLTLDSSMQGRVFKGNADLPGAKDFYRGLQLRD